MDQEFSFGGLAQRGAGLSVATYFRPQCARTGGRFLGYWAMAVWAVVAVHCYLRPSELRRRVRGEMPAPP
eukprot:1857081-Pyramimonas_sp.AAC.1